MDFNELIQNAYSAIKTTVKYIKYNIYIYIDRRI